MLATESEESVKRAILRLFPGTELRNAEGRMEGECDLVNFFELVRRQQARASFLAVARSNASGRETFLELNKTAALAGIVAVDAGSPMGPIRVRAPLQEFEEGFNNRPQ